MVDDNQDKSFVMIHKDEHDKTSLLIGKRKIMEKMKSEEKIINKKIQTKELKKLPIKTLAIVREINRNKENIGIRPVTRSSRRNTIV